MPLPLALGRFVAKLVETEFDVIPFNPGAELKEEINGEWAKREPEASEKGARLFDGGLARLLDYKVVRNVLHLSLQKTSYKTFVGTNLRAPDLPDDKRADPLGNSAVIVTADNRVVLGSRSSVVFGHPEMIHCFGGHIEPKRDYRSGQIDTFHSMICEGQW